MASEAGENGDLATRGIQIVKAKIGLLSNIRSLIYAPEYFEGVHHPSVIKGEGWYIHSQSANFQLKSTNYRSPPDLDGYFYVLNCDVWDAHISWGEDYIVAIGKWPVLEDETVDKRYTLLGNEGLLSKFILTILERKYGIYNFHASALYDEESDELLLVLGEKGSGKSSLMFSVLDKGLFKLFATEVVHAEITGDDVIFYKGAMRDNVRVGHLLYDFPGIAENIGVKFSELQDPWGTKVQVNLKKYEAKPDVITNPKVNLVIPRIEEYNKTCQYHFIKNMRRVKHILMENLSDKITSLTLIYETVPIGSIDNLTSRRRRLTFLDRFINKGVIKKVVSIFASPRNCLEGWL